MRPDQTLLEPETGKEIAIKSEVKSREQSCLFKTRGELPFN